MSENKRCPRCGEMPTFDINDAVSLTAHYASEHPQVPFAAMAAEVVAACS